VLSDFFFAFFVVVVVVVVFYFYFYNVQILESSINYLTDALKGAGASVSPFLSPSLITIIAPACQDPNRFVRESAYFCVTAILELANIALLQELVTCFRLSVCLKLMLSFYLFIFL
jgi:type IV secretory pathway TrbL component